MGPAFGVGILRGDDLVTTEPMVKFQFHNFGELDFVGAIGNDSKLEFAGQLVEEGG